MRPPPRTLAFLVVVLLSACGTGPPPADTGPQRDRDILTPEDFATGDFSNAYDVVRALRSQWLRTRGIDSFRSPTEVLVYWDDVRIGGVEELKRINLTTVAYIRYFDGLAASARWGLDHAQGVIFVSSRQAGSQPPPVGAPGLDS
jgi:hypothetical protein